MEILLSYGASKEAVNQGGETPYEWAVKAGQSESQRLLLGLADRASDEARGKEVRGVWQRPALYFPDFYGRRSGLESSIIVQVVLGTNI